MDATQDIAAIVLASGRSTRFGTEDKLLAKRGGVSIVEHAIRSIVESGITNCTVVVSSINGELAALLARFPFELNVCQNEHPESGMGSSIAIGASTIDSTARRGIAIFLGDMPAIAPSTIQQLAARFQVEGREKIVRPVYGKSPGHPVFFPAAHLPQLKRLTGDTGASGLIREHKNDLVLVDVMDPGVIADIDVPADMERFLRGDA